MKPEILDINKDKLKIDRLKSDKTVRVVDFFESQVEEFKKIKGPKFTKVKGVWVYFPWNKLLVHILEKDDYRIVRLSRNKNLINESEQKKFSKQIMGIAGLNVGNPGAVCIALEGGAEKMKFADNDSLELSNFNRFKASLGDLGINKAILSAQQVYEIDPFYELEIFEEGISEDNIDEFLTKPKIDLLIEEMDDLRLKIKIRERAKFYRIPVLMVTGNEAGLIVDIERFDIEQNLQLLNGYLKKDVVEKINKLSPKASIEEKANLARDFMGKELLASRLNKSFNLIGKGLIGIPQISESSFLRGAVLSYFSRQIAIGEEVISGRYLLNLDSLNKI